MSRTGEVDEVERLEALGRASRRTGLVSLAGLLVIVISLVYSSVSLTNLERRRAALDVRIRDQKATIEANERLITSQEGRLELFQGTTSRLLSKAPGLVKEAFAEAAADAGTTAVGPKGTPRPPGIGSEGKPLIVYIQVDDEGQRSQARQVQRALSETGFVLPGVENVGRRGIHVARSMVKFHPGPDAEAARAVQQKLQREFKTEVELKPTAGVKRGVLELWFASRDLR